MLSSSAGSKELRYLREDLGDPPPCRNYFGLFFGDRENLEEIMMMIKSYLSGKTPAGRNLISTKLYPHKTHLPVTTPTTQQSSNERFSWMSSRTLKPGEKCTTGSSQCAEKTRANHATRIRNDNRPTRHGKLRNFPMRPSDVHAHTHAMLPRGAPASTLATLIWRN